MLRTYSNKVLESQNAMCKSVLAERHGVILLESVGKIGDHLCQ
ncbi:protein of unknown function [Moritella yayanosii]|uniref:Uncharacterized protein n=1 Tax=Moritella yayanosii TaxID=69539 RepID=A0A330LL62_9GAMM|nr:protein of unknown function [Moritella yayanosii]